VSQVMKQLRSGLHGLVHCTGGGQTKCLRLNARVRFVKDSLFDVPPLFRLIMAAGGLGWEEMYQVFNMGHRMELFVDAGAASEVVEVARALGVDAKVVGRCEPSDSGRPELVLEGGFGQLSFDV